MDVSKVRALLKAAEEDRDHTKQKYSIEVEQRKELEGESTKLLRHVWKTVKVVFSDTNLTCENRDIFFLMAQSLPGWQRWHADKAVFSASFFLSPWNWQIVYFCIPEKSLTMAKRSRNPRASNTWPVEN